jgi:hypothetical protein
MDGLHLGYIRKFKKKKKKKKNPKPQTVVFFTMAVQKQAGKLK